ncbi:phytoene/squalene synthase family protein [Oceanobacillus piezotolerans]|uniref:Phytoene/squalene synthase family protein n=1 Tax=Oceanobacillus piezotolerans TaxID=2448030 RepID=A0A498D4Y4_9BACI|nr:phytoene/squalene synthase family protein [Oceanobacillus piezotolerans]RLL42011.1 phytoene/squalene synthase family protein [Oceanobacillus piezotolerans]
MSTEKKLKKDAMRVLKNTSRTFFIPISLLNPTLKMTVGSAYLCMRAIDEIEDHETLESETKQHLLRAIRDLLKAPFNEEAYHQLVKPFASDLPEVTLRLGDWLQVCPPGILEKVKESTSIMAGGMAKWVERDFLVESKEDLDEYTYYVAGLVGVMLSDIWEWYDDTKTDRDLAIGYGRGLQAVNMLRNQHEDAERGVSFLPKDWTRDDLFAYAKGNLQKADQYLESIETKNIIHFCKIPLALAKQTLLSLESGREKMSRKEVETTVEDIIKEG